MTHEIKPCPFCGGADEISTAYTYIGNRYKNRNGEYTVCCEKCGWSVTVNGYVLEELKKWAFRLWNTRKG